MIKLSIGDEVGHLPGHQQRRGNRTKTRDTGAFDRGSDTF